MKGRRRKEKESESERKEKRKKVRKVRKVIIHQSLRKTNRKTKATERERDCLKKMEEMELKTYAMGRTEI